MVWLGSAGQVWWSLGCGAAESTGVETPHLCCLFALQHTSLRSLTRWWAGFQAKLSCSELPEVLLPADTTRSLSQATGQSRPPGKAIFRDQEKVPPLGRGLQSHTTNGHDFREVSRTGNFFRLSTE